MDPAGRHIILFAFCLTAINSFAQTPQTIAYTTKENLPSNSVYRTVIDKKGFLWAATENGLARFDGRKFETYTTAKGLTDNEIVDLIIDSSGTIWAIPFRRSPCYYNPVKDRFENESTDPELNKIDLGNSHKVHVLKYGGVVFSNINRHLYVYKNGKTQAYTNILYPKTATLQKVVEYAPDKYLLFAEDTIRYFSGGKITRNIPFGRKGLSAAECINNKIYLAGSKNITAFTIDEKGNFFLYNEKAYPFEIRIFYNTGKGLALSSFTGTTYQVDTITLELKDIIYNQAQVRYVLEDKDGNTWFSTMENGLIKIQQKRISSFTDIPEVQQNFNALVKTKNIYAGTNNGEAFIYDGLYNIRRILLTEDKNIDAWVRRIVKTKQGIYVSTQTGSVMLDPATGTIKEKYFGQKNKSTKTATLLNDSILGMGTHSQAMKYNLNTGTYADSIAKRVISLVADKKGRVYIGSNDGLYRWDNDSLFFFGSMYKGFTYRVNTLACSPDGIIWAGLGSDSLLALKDDKLIASIPLGGAVPGNICKSLFCNKEGELWLGTNKGLNRIRYSYTDEKLSYSNTYFGTADGLIGEQVNDIAFDNDTIYVATSGGISYLPANLSLPAADIATFITRITISGQDEELKENYTVPFSKNDITIEFSGVDLTGFVPLFEYSINNSDWKQTDKIELKKLSPGSYNIKIRALKRDGAASAQQAVVNIKIKTPFWKNTVLQTLFVLLAFGSILYFIQRRNRQRQKAAVTKVLTEKKIAELEMQALKAQINPHFVFNCLNSIKGFIYDRDYKQADIYLDKFSGLLRSTMDNADAAIIPLDEEIKYLDTYLQLEKLRFADKFDYSIFAEPGIDKQKTYVPAMLLQPYVENAIRHGVRFLENKKGKINITARKEGTFLVCEIDDNGIGREKAAALKSSMHIEYQSRGMQLSRRRAELYNIQQRIIDKKNENGDAAGTTIIISIPLELKP